MIDTEYQKIAVAFGLSIGPVVWVMSQGVPFFWGGFEVFTGLMILVLSAIIIKEHRGYVFRVLDDPRNNHDDEEEDESE